MDITLYTLYLLIGIALGVLTGLTPGLHFNNVALFAIFLASAFSLPTLYLAVMVMATMITHTFLDFIPSIFLGAPSEDTSLSVLPTHRMLLDGRGMEAVHLTAQGSLLAYLFSLAFIPFIFLLFSIFSLQRFLPRAIPYLLLSMILILFYWESKKSLKHMLYASAIFVLSGILGIITLTMPVTSSPIPFHASLLFPVFTGLFGFPVLILSRNNRVPPQRISRQKINYNSIKSAFRGALSASLVAFLPGVTSGIAATISQILSRNRENENFLITLGSVNTANYTLNLLSLFLILRPRSMAVEILGTLVPIQTWKYLIFPPSNFILLLLTGLLAAFASYFLTIRIGILFTGWMTKFGKNYGRLSTGILLILFAFVFLFTGLVGILIGIVATLIGLLPPKLGIMRTHLMGVLILPVIINYL